MCKFKLPLGKAGKAGAMGPGCSTSTGLAELRACGVVARVSATKLVCSTLMGPTGLGELGVVARVGDKCEPFSERGPRKTETTQSL